MGEFFRQVIGIHILVAGYQQLRAVRLHQLQEAAPLIFDPHSGEILRFRADNQHDFSRIQGRENIRLIRLAQLVLQGNGSIKYLQSLQGQLVVNIVGDGTVHGTLAVFIGFLVADEYIKRFFILNDVQNILLDRVDCLRFRFVDALLHCICIGNCRQIISIGGYGIIRGAVTGGNPFKGFGVLHVFNTVLTQHDAPMGLSLRVIFLQNFLIDLLRFVKFTLDTQIVGAVEQILHNLVIYLWQCLLGAAECTFCNGFPDCNFQIAAAHFAFDNCHNIPTFRKTG